MPANPRGGSMVRGAVVDIRMLKRAILARTSQPVIRGVLETLLEYLTQYLMDSERFAGEAPKGTVKSKATTRNSTRHISAFQLLQAKFQKETPSSPITRRREVGGLSSQEGWGHQMKKKRGEGGVYNQPPGGGSRRTQVSAGASVQKIIARFSAVAQKEMKEPRQMSKDQGGTKRIGRGLVLSAVIGKFEAIATVHKGGNFPCPKTHPKANIDKTGQGAKDHKRAQDSEKQDGQVSVKKKKGPSSADKMKSHHSGLKCQDSYLQEHTEMPGHQEGLTWMEPFYSSKEVEQSSSVSDQGTPPCPNHWAEASFPSLKTTPPESSNADPVSSHFSNSGLQQLEAYGSETSLTLPVPHLPSTANPAGHSTESLSRRSQPSSLSSNPGYEAPSPCSQSSNPGNEVSSLSSLSTNPGHQTSSSPSLSSNSDYKASSPCSQSSHPGYEAPSPCSLSSNTGQQDPSPCPLNFNSAYKASSPCSLSANPGYEASSPSSQSANPGYEASSPSSLSANAGNEVTSPSSLSATPGHQPSSACSLSSNTSQQDSLPCSINLNPSYEAPSTFSLSFNPDYEGSSPCSLSTNPSQKDSSPCPLNFNSGLEGSLPCSVNANSGYEAASPSSLSPTPGHQTSSSYSLSSNTGQQDTLPCSINFNPSYEAPSSFSLGSNPGYEASSPNSLSINAGHQATSTCSLSSSSGDKPSSLRSQSVTHGNEMPSYSSLSSNPCYEALSPCSLSTNPSHEAPSNCSSSSNTGYEAPSLCSLSSNTGQQDCSACSLRSNPGQEAPSSSFLSSNPSYEAHSPCSLSAKPGYEASSLSSLSANPGNETLSVSCQSSNLGYEALTPSSVSTKPSHEASSLSSLSSNPGYRGPSACYLSSKLDYEASSPCSLSANPGNEAPSSSFLISNPRYPAPSSPESRGLGFHLDRRLTNDRISAQHPSEQTPISPASRNISLQHDDLTSTNIKIAATDSGQLPSHASQQHLPRYSFPRTCGSLTAERDWATTSLNSDSKPTSGNVMLPNGQPAVPEPSSVPTTPTTAPLWRLSDHPAPEPTPSTLHSGGLSITAAPSPLLSENLSNLPSEPLTFDTTASFPHTHLAPSRESCLPPAQQDQGMEGEKRFPWESQKGGDMQNSSQNKPALATAQVSSEALLENNPPDYYHGNPKTDNQNLLSDKPLIGGPAPRDGPKYRTRNYAEACEKKPYKPKIIRFADTFTF